MGSSIRIAQELEVNEPDRLCVYTIRRKIQDTLQGHIYLLTGKSSDKNIQHKMQNTLKLFNLPPTQQNEGNIYKLAANISTEPLVPIVWHGTSKAQPQIESKSLNIAKDIDYKIAEEYFDNPYSYIYYIIKMISLQENYCLNNDIWISDLNIHCAQTGVILYVSVKNGKLPTAVMRTPEFQSQMQNVNVMNEMNEIINGTDEMKKIFDIKKPWHNVNVFINEKECNKEETKLTMTKPNFLNALLDAATESIKLIPILLFTNRGYSIGGLWILQIRPNVDIGISFASHPKDNSIKPSGIHICLESMKLHCQLTGQFNAASFDGFESLINNFHINEDYPNIEAYESESTYIDSDWEEWEDDETDQSDTELDEKSKDNIYEGNDCNLQV